MLAFRILGTLEVLGENGPLRLGGPKQRAVLVILLLNANRVVPIDRLADDVYDDAPPATALTQIQAQISQLRKLLDPHRRAGAPGSLIETRAPGYLIRLAPEQLDLRTFERLVTEAAEASDRGDLTTASSGYRHALDLWRGQALAEFGRDSFSQPAIARLEDLRLGALEERIDIDLALGRHGELVGELEELVAEHPLRERIRGQLMLALYRSGRQAEALDAYRRFRRTLVEELGIEPGPPLQELERAILTQDASLELERTASVTPGLAGSVLVVASSDTRLDPLLTLAEPLAKRTGRELILARPVGEERELAPAAAATNARRRTLTVGARAAAFTTSEPAHDVVRMTRSHDAELVLLDAPDRLDGDRLPEELAEILLHSPAQIAILAGTRVDLKSGTGVFVPFGAGEHDWAALELGALLASSMSAPLRLVGTRAQPGRGQRDASLLLADASLAVQRLVDVDSEPLLADRTENDLVRAVAEASLIVMGVSPRWRRDGIGDMRRALMQAGPPVLLVHRGPRPGALAPRKSRTRFTWSLQS